MRYARWVGFGWLRRIGFAIILSIVVLGIVGASYQAIETRKDALRFPAKGRFIDVGGYKLNLNCSGQGSPTVILESGAGVLAIDWNKVQPRIAQFTRVCSYDRAGYGWSDPGPMPRTSAQISKELHTLMRNAGENAPFVLVGHSAGGLDVRVYNDHYPNEVSGMVLVDATHEDQANVMPPAMKKVSDEQVRAFDRRMEIEIFRERFGISRLESRAHDEESLLDLQPKFIEAMKSELDSFPEDAAEVRAAADLGDKPLIVLTAGKERIPPQFSRQDFEAYNRSWVDDLQMRETHLSRRGKRIIVDSGHMIPLERPDAVVSAVQEICGK